MSGSLNDRERKGLIFSENKQNLILASIGISIQHVNSINETYKQIGKWDYNSWKAL